MFQAQGYKKWEDKIKRVGENVFQTKRYQKRVDWLEGWGNVPLCLCNDKLFININESTINTYPTTYSIELVAEGKDDVWADLKLYSLTQEQIENNLPKYEQKLKKMWVVFNEENCNV